MVNGRVKVRNMPRIIYVRLKFCLPAGMGIWVHPWPYPLGTGMLLPDLQSSFRESQRWEGQFQVSHSHHE